MQSSVREAINNLGTEVNTFTTDMGAFVKNAADQIAALTALIKGIPNGDVDAAEVAAAITAQTTRLETAHRSLTDFTIPPVPDTATVPPTITAPVVDPNADTIPAQPPVGGGGPGEG